MKQNLLDLTDESTLDRSTPSLDRSTPSLFSEDVSPETKALEEQIKQYEEQKTSVSEESVTSQKKRKNDSEAPQNIQKKARIIHGFFDSTPDTTKDEGSQLYPRGERLRAITKS